MTNEIEKLQEIALKLKQMNYKIKLIKLIKQAKKEYDSYNFQTAKIYLDEAYQLNASNPAVLRGLGCICQINQDYTRALRYYKKALRYSDNKEIEYTLIGTIFYLFDKYEKSIKYFNLAIDANDNYESAYEKRNQALLENHIKIIEIQETLQKYF